MASLFYLVDISIIGSRLSNILKGGESETFQFDKQKTYPGELPIQPFFELRKRQQISGNKILVLKSEKI